MLPLRLQFCVHKFLLMTTWSETINANLSFLSIKISIRTDWITISRFFARYHAARYWKWRFRKIRRCRQTSLIQQELRYRVAWSGNDSSKLWEQSRWQSTDRGIRFAFSESGSGKTMGGGERAQCRRADSRRMCRKSTLQQRLLPAGKRGPVRSPITGFRKVRGVDPLAHATYAG